MLSMMSAPVVCSFVIHDTVNDVSDMLATVTFCGVWVADALVSSGLIRSNANRNIMTANPTSKSPMIVGIFRSCISCQSNVLLFSSSSRIDTSILLDNGLTTCWSGRATEDVLDVFTSSKNTHRNIVMVVNTETSNKSLSSSILVYCVR